MSTLSVWGASLLRSLKGTFSIVNFLGDVRTYRTSTSDPLDIRLNNLNDNPGARIQRTRVGRGIGSTKGKTCGRGHKGQKSRSGASSHHDRTFEGGQTPLYKRMRKFGFHNPNKIEYDWLNLGQLQYFIDRGRLDTSKPITMKELYNAKCIKKIKEGVKLLGRDAHKLKSSVHLELSATSLFAKQAVEALGGTVTTVYFTKPGLRALFKPEVYDHLPGRAAPLPSKAHLFDSWGPNTLPRSERPPPKKRSVPVRIHFLKKTKAARASKLALKKEKRRAHVKRLTQ